MLGLSDNRARPRRCLQGLKVAGGPEQEAWSHPGQTHFLAVQQRRFHTSAAYSPPTHFLALRSSMAARSCDSSTVVGPPFLYTPV